MSHPRISSLWAVLALFSLTLTVSGQLDLPEKTDAGGAGQEGGTPAATPPKEKVERKKKKGGLSLPRKVRGDLAPGSEGRGGLYLPRTPERVNPAPRGESLPPPRLGPHADARFVFEALEKTRDHQGEVAENALQQLFELGPAGLAAARIGLASNHAPTLWVSSRFITSYGAPEDRLAYAERLRSKVPTNLAGPLLRNLSRADPTLTSPAYMATLLDHPIGSMRQEAFHQLKAKPDQLPFATLVVQAESSRSTTRGLALSLLSLIPGSASINVIAKRLGDEHSKVAAIAASLLAQLENPTVTELLRQRAFEAKTDGNNVILASYLDFSPRERAYALLSLVEREKNLGQSLMGDEDVPRLLRGLDAQEPVVVAASAVALAGVGFRSVAFVDSGWLDREVPHLLVRFGTGVEFHKDLSSLIRPASERLALLSGENFGLDGSAWRAWWVEHADGFEARRGALPIGPGESSLFELVYETSMASEPGDIPAMRYLGPAVPTPEDEHDVIYLDSAEAGELVAILRGHGVLSAETLGDGTVTGARRIFTLRVREREKRLSYEADHVVPWITEVRSTLERVNERHVWQRFHDPEKFSSQREYWEVYREWWASASPRDRSRRLKDLLLARLLSPRPEGAETFPLLIELYGEIGIPEAADFPAFLQLIAHEALWNARARKLFELARTSAKAGTSEEARRAGAAIDPVRGSELLRESVTRFGRAAERETAGLLEELGEARVRAAASDEVLELRRLAATLLAKSEVPESRALALELCEDPEVRVAEAAVMALGHARVEDARLLLERKSSEGRPRVRGAAIVALGRLGGPGVGDRALELLAERDPNLQKAAVEALAELCDPSYASLLAALFSRGPDSLLFESAQRGLRRLGSAAHPEILRLSSSQNQPARRASALLLAEQGVPEAASLLMTMLTDERADLRVLEELSILTCVDFTRTEDPVNAAWDWWDEVVHDDSIAWLLAEAQRQEFATPDALSLAAQSLAAQSLAAQSLAGGSPPGTAAGARFLLTLIERGAYPLERRAMRELGRRLGLEIERPRETEELAVLLEELDEKITEVYGR